MRTWLLVPVSTIIIALTSACIKSSTKDAQKECEGRSDYAWHDGACVPKQSQIYREAQCKEAGDDYIWINNICEKKEEILEPKERCEAKNDGSHWRVNAATGVGSCEGPTRFVTAEEECQRLADHIWDSLNHQCLSPEAQACNKGGDFWVDNQCLNRAVYLEREKCVKRHDGSEWRQFRCVTLNERQCNDRGYRFIWRGTADGSGQCDRKTFEDFCVEETAADDIKHTVSLVMSQLSIVGRTAKQCEQAGDQLALKSSLNLDGKKLKSLLPLSGLSNLKELNLQSNLISDLEPLSTLNAITKINLTANQIEDVSPLVGLRFLTALHLGENRIANLAPLAGLKSLRDLYLNENKVRDVNPLVAIDAILDGGLGQLKVLSLDQNCDLQDARSLARLSSLTHLSLKLTGIPKEKLPEFSSSAPAIEHSQCP